MTATDSAPAGPRAREPDAAEAGEGVVGGEEVEAEIARPVRPKPSRMLRGRLGRFASYARPIGEVVDEGQVGRYRVDRTGVAATAAAPSARGRSPRSMVRVSRTSSSTRGSRRIQSRASRMIAIAATTRSRPAPIATASPGAVSATSGGAPPRSSGARLAAEQVQEAPRIPMRPGQTRARGACPGRNRRRPQ